METELKHVQMQRLSQNTRNRDCHDHVYPLLALLSSLVHNTGQLHFITIFIGITSHSWNIVFNDVLKVLSRKRGGNEIVQYLAIK